MNKPDATAERTLSCCIVQPTFIPWIGWFDIIDQVDIVVFLDDAAFSERSWQQRNRIRTSKGLEYLTVPVMGAGRRGQLINEVETVNLQFVASIEGKVRANYQPAPWFKTAGLAFASVLRDSSVSGRLLDINLEILKWLFSELGLEKAVIRSSDLKVPGKRGERLALLSEAVGASKYLSTVGARDYLIEDLSFFHDRSISVDVHEYIHPHYRQLHEPFLAYASILDLLLLKGNQALDIIRSGRRPSSQLSQGV